MLWRKTRVDALMLGVMPAYARQQKRVHSVARKDGRKRPYVFAALWQGMTKESLSSGRVKGAVLRIQENNRTGAMECTLMVRHASRRNYISRDYISSAVAAFMSLAGSGTRWAAFCSVGRMASTFFTTSRSTLNPARMNSTCFM